MKPYLTHPFVLIPLAALLGGIIGWFLRRIIALREAHQASQALSKKLKGRDRYIAQLKTELADAEGSVEAQSQSLQQLMDERESREREQKEAIEEYLVRMRAAESKLMSLQRNYLIFKAQKQREVEQLQNNLDKVLPLRRELEDRIEDYSDEDGIDMDSTLELDPQLRQEKNPFILRNALISEKRKVEHLSLVKKELSETYFRFAEEKQRWVAEKQALQQRIEALESEQQRRRTAELLSAELAADKK
ncbi:hypothetical protein Q4485_14465 [Granulosicoccaceae sp. 1_MG-2023]|nr:hypothetical protein [Granulosicoccaceae sp. 1_MG-2023]